MHPHVPRHIPAKPLRKVTVDLATISWWPAYAGRSQKVDPESERVTEEQDRTTAAVRDDAGIRVPLKSLWPKQRRREVERASPEVSLPIPANVNTAPINHEHGSGSSAYAVHPLDLVEVALMHRVHPHPARTTLRARLAPLGDRRRGGARRVQAAEYAHVRLGDLC